MGNTNVCCPIPSHGIPIGMTFLWTSQHIDEETLQLYFETLTSKYNAFNQRSCFIAWLCFQ